MEITISRIESEITKLRVGRIPGVVADIDIKEFSEAVFEQELDILKVKCNYRFGAMFRQLNNLGFPFSLSVINHSFESEHEWKPELPHNYSGMRLVEFSEVDQANIENLMKSTWNTATFSAFESAYDSITTEQQNRIAIVYALEHMQEEKWVGFLLKDQSGNAVGITYGFFDGDIFEQEYVGVLSAERGKNYGAALYDLVNNWLAERNVFRKRGNISIDNVPSKRSLYAAANDVFEKGIYAHFHIYPYLSHRGNSIQEEPLSSPIGIANWSPTIRSGANINRFTQASCQSSNGVVSSVLKKRITGKFGTILEVSVGLDDQHSPISAIYHQIDE